LDENYKVVRMFSPRSQDYGDLDNLDNIIGKILRTGPTIRKGFLTIHVTTTANSNIFEPAILSWKTIEKISSSRTTRHRL